MSATYNIGVAQQLWDSAGPRVVNQVDGLEVLSWSAPHDRGTAGQWVYVTVKDDNAPAELDGQFVELHFRAHYEGGVCTRITIGARTVVTNW